MHSHNKTQKKNHNTHTHTASRKASKLVEFWGLFSSIVMDEGVCIFEGAAWRGWGRFRVKAAPSNSCRSRGMLCWRGRGRSSTCQTAAEGSAPPPMACMPWCSPQTCCISSVHWPSQQPPTITHSKLQFFYRTPFFSLFSVFCYFSFFSLCKMKYVDTCIYRYNVWVGWGGVGGRSVSMEYWPY